MEVSLEVEKYLGGKKNDNFFINKARSKIQTNFECISQNV